ncbi:MAG: aminopeptidase, partial [Bacteroidota bacterium]|nr:aminopeptidase [Bacteroidota bacterium]
MLLDYYNDPHTYSNTDTVKITHIHLELDVDFEHQVLKGHAILHLNKEKDCKELILDTWGLHIYKTAVGHENQETHFSLGEHDELLGAPLSVEIEENTEIVTIYYTTSPNAKALQWMLATDISNKHLLFSQSQAILARSWVPLQDSPSVRFTYNASITVPTGYLPLMSAENPAELREDNKYMFKMEQAIPSYLLAIAVGNFVFQPLGDRTGVYAEPNLIEASAWEFADMQKMLEAGEALYGAYRWDRYDVLVLPGSFPFGGMENPRLTFATP